MIGSPFMDIPPWHFRTTITSPLEHEAPVTTLRDAVQTYADLPLGVRDQATVTIIESGHEGALDGPALDALIEQLPPLL